MQLLKALLIIVIIIAAVLYGGGYLLSSEATVQRSVLINAAPEKVYGLVAAPRAWKDWSVWTRRDPAMQIEYSGPESGSGAVWSWKSKSEGDGRMTFTETTAPSVLGYELYFPDFQSTSKGDFRFEPQGRATRVTWTIHMIFPSPLLRWMGLFADKMVGKDFDGGLANLKAVAEKG